MTRGRTALLRAVALAATTLGCGGTAAGPSSPAPVTPGGGFTLTSPAFVDGGTLPAEYTCDGAGTSPVLSWTDPPAGTREFAVLMSTLPGDGTTKWNWVVYAIPASTISLARGGTGGGTVGVGSDGPQTAYQPPCSQGPGAKSYTFTIHALSGSPRLTVPPSQVTGAVLTSAIGSITLGNASITVSYTRPLR